MASNKSNKVFLICDQKWRDLPTVSLFSEALKKIDIKAIIVNSREAKHLIPIYQPDIVVLNNLYSPDLQELAKTLKALNILVVVLPTEGRGEPSLDRLNDGTFSDLQSVDLYFTWNTRTKKTLEKKYKHVNFFPLGCLRYDLFDKKFEKFIKPKKLSNLKYKLRSKAKTVLWTTKFGYAKIFEQNIKTQKIFFNSLKKSMVTHCYDLDGIDWKKIPENQSVTRLMHAKMFFKLVKSMPQVDFLIKPHPTEETRFYEEFIENLNLKNCKVCKEEFIFDLLETTDLLIQQKCTTALEAWIANIPVIDLSISKFSEFDWPEYIIGNECVSNFQGLFEKVNYILNNNYKPSKSKMQTRLYWIREFTNKLEGLMSFNAANEINVLLNNRISPKKIILPMHLKLKHLDCIRMGLKYLLSLTSEESLINFFKNYFFKKKKYTASKEITRTDVKIYLNRLNNIYEN